MNRRFRGFTVLAWLLVCALPSWAANYRTRNFIVTAPTPELAREFGELAEKYRREKALEWLGREMPPWPQPCPLHVTVTLSAAKGATRFNFGAEITQDMEISGPINALRYSVLPHEVTHTVFAHHFRQPVPRWADEGGAVLSENDTERQRHDAMCRQLLNAGRGFQLRVLFNLREYPSDVMVLYAEGYSITRYLVDLSNRQTFLAFVGHGMQYGWDSAVQTYYRMNSVSELEHAWLEHLRRPTTAVVSAPPSSRPGVSEQTNQVIASAELTNRVIRSGTPSSLPGADAGFVARGTSEPSDLRGSWGSPRTAPIVLDAPRPVSSTPATELQAPAAANANANVTSRPTMLPEMLPTTAPRPTPPPPPVVLFPPEPIYNR